MHPTRATRASDHTWEKGVVNRKEELEAVVEMLAGDRTRLRQLIELINEQIEILELEEEVSALESELEQLTEEKKVSEDYLDILKAQKKTKVVDASLAGHS